MYGAARVTPGVPEHQSVCDTPQLGDKTTDTCQVQQSQSVTASLNMRWTDPGHVTSGQTSTKLVPEASITDAGDSVPRESPSQLQHWGTLGKGHPGVPHGGEADGKCTHFVLAG